MEIDPSVYFVSRSRRLASRNSPPRRPASSRREHSVWSEPLLQPPPTPHSVRDPLRDEEAIEAFAAMMAARQLSHEAMTQLARRAVERANALAGSARRTVRSSGRLSDASSTSSSVSAASSGRGTLGSHTHNSAHSLSGATTTAPSNFTNLSRSRETLSYTSELLDLRRDEITAEADRLEEAKADLARERKRLEAASAELRHAHHELHISLPHNAAARIQAEMRANAARAEFAARRASAESEAHKIAVRRKAEGQARAERRLARAQLKLALILQCTLRARMARRRVDGLRAAHAEERQRKLMAEGALRRKLARRERRDLENRSAAALQASMRGRWARRSDVSVLRMKERERKAALTTRLKRRDAALMVQRVARGKAARLKVNELRAERIALARMRAANSRSALKERRAATILQGWIRKRKAEREHKALRLRTTHERRRSVSELRRDMQRRVAVVAITSAWRGKRARRIARMRRDAAADQEAAKFYWEEGERLRIERMQAFLSNASRTEGAASAKQPSLPGRPRVGGGEDLSKGGSADSLRAAARRRMSAALLIQSYAHRRMAIRLVAPQRRMVREAKVKRVEDRIARRRAAKMTAAATLIQSAARMHAARIVIGEKRALNAERQRAMDAVRRAAASYLKSVDSLAEAEQRRATNAAAAILQAVTRGRRARKLASALAKLPPDPRVVVHSVAIDDETLSTYHQLWFAVELGNEGLLRQTTKVRQPYRGLSELRFEETFLIKLVDGESFRTADRLRELLRDTSDDDNVEMDLVFTLFGKHGASPVQALGEAYVNLKEMLASGSDLAPPNVLEILNTRDKVVGRLSVSVTAMEAFRKLSSPQLAPSVQARSAGVFEVLSLTEPTSCDGTQPHPPFTMATSTAATSESDGTLESTMGGRPAVGKGDGAPTQGMVEEQIGGRQDMRISKCVSLDRLLRTEETPPSPELPLEARHTEADFHKAERHFVSEGAGRIEPVDGETELSKIGETRSSACQPHEHSPLAVVSPAGQVFKEDPDDDYDIGDFELE